LCLPIVTKLDIATIVGIINQFMQDLGLPHWKVVKMILRYLQGIKFIFFQYFGARNGTIIIGFCDSNWGGDLDTWCSTTKFTFLFAHATIIWLSKLQTIMALSTTKAKYVATSQATHEAI
jgi:hypothetical protein